MKLKRKKMCKECPFSRKSLKGYLGGEDSPTNFVLGVLQETRMPCHMTVNYEEDDWRDQLESAHRCVGSLIFMRNSCKSPQDKELAAAVNQFKTDKETVFSNLQEFISHHTLPEKG